MGFKWTIRPKLLMQGAIYRLDRDNQPVTIGPDTFARGLTRTRGKELEISGYVTDKCRSSAVRPHRFRDPVCRRPYGAGRQLRGIGSGRHLLDVEQVSAHREIGRRLGVIYQGSWFPEASNGVKVPSYTRFDSAVFYDFNEHWSAQVNIENMFDTEYWISSHNDNNISYGAPAQAFATLKARW